MILPPVVPVLLFIGRNAAASVIMSVTSTVIKRLDKRHRDRENKIKELLRELDTCELPPEIRKLLKELK